MEYDKKQELKITRNIGGLIRSLKLSGYDDFYFILRLKKTDVTVRLLNSDLESDRDTAYRMILRRLRYWCFRFKTEATGGPKVDIDLNNLKILYENDTDFDGWENFGISWDIDKYDMTKTIKRLYTMYEEWEAVLRQVVPNVKIKPIVKKDQKRIKPNIDKVKLCQP